MSLQVSRPVDARWLLPGESIVSIMWKFARANGLSGQALVRLAGADIDLYEGVEPMRDVVDLKQLRRRLLLPGKVLYASLLDAGQRGGITRHSGIAGSAYRSVITALGIRCSVKTAVPPIDRNLKRDASIAGRRHLIF